jgi:PAS domain S-box-containing protein
MRLSIKPAHSVILLAGITVCVVIVAVLVLLSDLKTRELAHSREETQSLTQLFMRQTEHSFESADLVLQGVQERLHTTFGRQFPLDSAQVHLLLNTRAHALHATGSLFLVNERGQVVNGSNSDTDLSVNVSNQHYYKAFLANTDPGLIIERPQQNKDKGSWTLNMARRIEGINGEFKGVIVVAMQIANLEQLFSHVKLEYDRPISIYMADGILVASSPHRETLLGTLAPELNKESLPQLGGEVKTIQHQSGNGTSAVFSLGRLKNFPFLVSVMNDEDMSLASWRETSVPITLGAVLMLIAIVTVAGFLKRELEREEAMALALNEAHIRYHHTIESVMDAIVGIDEKQNILLFNPAAEKMFQMNSKEVLGRPLSNLLPMNMRHSHQSHVAAFSDSEGASRAMAPRLDVMGRRSDGTEFPIESSISKTSIGGNVQMTAVLRDVTKRRQAEAEMRQLNEQLRDLSSSLQEVREQERSRISRELHDDIGQQLTGLKLELAWLSSRLKEGMETPIDRVSDMKKMLDVAITSVRRISSDLRPLILDDFGFSEAVEWHVTEVSKRSNLQIELNLPSHELVHDVARATALFRIVQESLTNILRHAHAKHVSVTLAAVGDAICLCIQDDGVGMPEKIRVGGIGLVSMRERVNALGGVFNISAAFQSESHPGVRLEVRLPLMTDEVGVQREN